MKRKAAHHLPQVLALMRLHPVAPGKTRLAYAGDGRRIRFDRPIDPQGVVARFEMAKPQIELILVALRHDHGHGTGIPRQAAGQAPVDHGQSAQPMGLRHLGGTFSGR